MNGCHMTIYHSFPSDECRNEDKHKSCKWGSVGWCQIDRCRVDGCQVDWCHITVYTIHFIQGNAKKTGMLHVKWISADNWMGVSWVSYRWVLDGCHMTIL